MSTGNLPDEGKKLWEKVYNDSLSSDCDQECAAKKAWAAVKNAGWTKTDTGEWVKKSLEFDSIQEFSMAIVKATREKSDGTMRIRMVNSDTGEDAFGERMSLELFQDFVYRSNNNVSVPPPFDAVIKNLEHGYWVGGPPYLSISHFRSGGGKNVPGKQESLYIDGDKLKSVDILFPNDLGNAVWKAIYDDLYGQNKGKIPPVRVSIGFLDYAHKHVGANHDGTDFVFVRTSLNDRCPMCAEGIGGKVYLKGQLIHKAFTRVPANERTSVEIDKMGIKTRKEDAKSIVGDLADTLEEKTALADAPADIIVTKDDDNVSDRNVSGDSVIEDSGVASDDIKIEESNLLSDRLESAFSALRNSAISLKFSNKSGDDALQKLQEDFDRLGEAIKAEFSPAETSDIKSVLRSVFLEILPELKSSIIAELSLELGKSLQTIQSQQPALPVKSQATQDKLVSRSIRLSPVQEAKRSKIEELARKSVGL
jgi:hypothetical protein